jgi:hypothetical protein
MSELGRFQDAFTAALTGDAAPLAPWLDPSAPGLAVYRNTVAKGAVDALVANYPAVERLVGAEWLGAAAAEYARAHPPSRPSLLAYGEGFAGWIVTFPPAAGLPYLADVARLDRLWTEAHLAADAEPLGVAALAALTPDALARTGARLHPSAHIAAFAHNSPSLWLAHRFDAAPPANFAWEETAEAVLLVRPAGRVEARLLTASEHAFLASLRAGGSLAEAAAAALGAEPSADLAALVSSCLEEGLLVALEPVTEPPR